MRDNYQIKHIKKIPENSDYNLIKPIPVIVEERKEEGCYFVRAGELGIRCPGAGETIQEACKNLIEVIIEEANVLMNAKRNLRGDDEFRLKKMQEYLSVKASD